MIVFYGDSVPIPITIWCTMAKKQTTSNTIAEVLVRQSEVTYKSTTVRLCDIDNKTKRHKYCHRADTALKYNDSPDASERDASMKHLVDSLQLEGQQVPIEYFVDKNTGAKILIRGYRRVEALWIAIERRFNPEVFYREMEISAIEVESVADLDYLIRSVCDNEVRLGLEEEEKLLTAEQLLADGASSSRAARALGVSQTHFARYQRRIASPIMRAHIAAGHLAATSADELLEIASRHNRVGQLETDFDHVVDKIEDHINTLRADAILNQNEFKEDKLGVVSKHINKGFINSWLKGIKESKHLDWQAEPVAVGWTYECSFDLKSGKLKIEALNKDAHSMSCSDLGQLSGKLSVLSHKVENFWKKKLAEEKLWATMEQEEDEDLIDYFDRNEAVHLADELRAKAAKARGEADLGHNNVTPRDETVLADTITVPPQPETPPYDPVIDGGPVGPPESVPPVTPATPAKSSRKAK